jgi:thioredoxin-related protein
MPGCTAITSTSMRIAFLLAALLAMPLLAAPEYPQMGPDTYDTKANGEKLIGDAIGQAKHEHKRVLVLFGANWCPWCRRLHRALTFDQTVADSIRRSCVLVYVDANTRNDRKRNASVIEKYGNPLQYGLPVFVVLDPDGTRLTTRETQTLAGATDSLVAEKLLSYLAEWRR